MLVINYSYVIYGLYCYYYQVLKHDGFNKMYSPIINRQITHSVWDLLTLFLIWQLLDRRCSMWNAKIFIFFFFFSISFFWEFVIDCETKCGLKVAANPLMCWFWITLHNHWKLKRRAISTWVVRGNLWLAWEFSLNHCYGLSSPKTLK